MVVMPPVNVSLLPALTVMTVSESRAQPPLVLKTRPARVLLPTRLVVPEPLKVMTLAGSMMPPSRWVKSAVVRVRPPAGR